MKTSVTFIMSLFIMLLFDSFLFCQDFTREPQGNLTTRVNKLIYPDNSYSFEDEDTYDYGTYIPAPNSKTLGRSIWSYNLPTDLPYGSYLKKVELKYNGNSIDQAGFEVSYIESYPSNPSYSEKWNIADNGTNSKVLPFANGSVRTVEVSSLLEPIRNAHLSGKSVIYLAFKASTDNMNVRWVTLYDMSIVFTYDIRNILTIDNNFIDNNVTGTRGSIVIDGQSKIIPSDGYKIYKLDGESTSLQAVSPQTNSYGYQMIWNTGSCEKSEWKRNYEHLTDNQTYNFYASNSDDGLRYMANLAQNHATTSGALLTDEKWFTNVSLSRPVYVPSGVTLTITSCAEVSLNGNSIVSIGGTITEQSGASYSGLVAYRKAGSTVVGIYSNIQTALNAATSGDVVDVRGTQSLSGNLVIANGVTFLVNANLNIGSFTITTTSGIISVPNEASISHCAYLKQNGAIKGIYPSIQSAINVASSGYSISLQGTTYNESANFSSKSGIILNGTGTSVISSGVSITNSTGIAISGLRMSNGPSINGGSSNSFTNSTVTGVTALSNYNSPYNSVTNITAENIEASFGIYSYGGTGSISYSKIKNGDCGIYLSNSGTWNIRTGNEFCGNGYDVYASSPAYAYVTDNTSYSSSSPVAGNYTLEEDLPLQNICGMRKESSTEEKNEINTDISPEFKELDQRYLELMSSVLKDKEENKYDLKNYTKEYEELIKEYKKFLDDKNDKETIKSAIKQISNLYKDQENKQGLYNFINETTTSGKLKSMYPYFKRYLIWKAIDESDYEGALKLTDEILALKDVAEDLKPEMLYEKGLIYKYYLNDKEKSGVMFTLILKNYPKSELCKLAALEQGVDFSITIDKKKNNTQQSEIPNENVLGNAYPNPFNPTTVISYSLKKQGYITLTVFDVLGKEVARLVDGVQTEGQHRVNFNGIDLPSGIYVYQLKGSDFILNKKMQLIK